MSVPIKHTLPHTAPTKSSIPLRSTRSPLLSSVLFSYNSMLILKPKTVIMHCLPTSYLLFRILQTSCTLPLKNFQFPSQESVFISCTNSLHTYGTLNLLTSTLLSNLSEFALTLCLTTKSTLACKCLSSILHPVPHITRTIVKSQVSRFLTKM